MLGNWESIAPEVRPSASKNPGGSLKPFYLKRAFKYRASDRCELEIVNLALRRCSASTDQDRRAHAVAAPHPIARGAQEVDFVADERYEVTPFAQGFADVLNKVASAGYALWR
jgi:hypothetical protein